jgi:hypothetical protein
MAYKKDYGLILACIPLRAAELLVERLEVSDGVDTVNFKRGHLFRDDLLFLMDIPLDGIMDCLGDYQTVGKMYPSIYSGMDVSEEQESHFKKIIKPVLLLRLQEGI